MSWFCGRQEDRSFNVMIYEQDYKELCAWVLKKPNIETGGDLFGLWADKHTAVIQLVLGPGKRCTRTTASFYQDIEYLRRVGSYLTENEGVCHIGEWHSHHQLGLARPSGGDENTVWNNMPTYNLKRFVIFIANIQSSKKSYNVNVGCFLFEIDDQGKHMDVLRGKFTILQKTSPLLGKPEVSEERNRDAEKDDQNKIIVIKELKMEVEGGKRPCVTYLKPIPAPNSERKRGNNNNRSQPANQNKPSDEGSHVDSKKRKMNTDERSPDKTCGTPPSEDLENLTINDKMQEVMEQEIEMEEPIKSSQVELKHEGEREKSQGENSGNIEENQEAGPPQAEQGNREKEDGLGRETTPGGKTQKPKEEEEQTTNMGTAKTDTRTEEKSESEDGVLQGSIEGNKKKLEIKIESKKSTPQPPGAKKADLSQSGSKSPKGSLPGSDVNQLATNDEQPDEKSEEAMKQQEKKEMQDKKNQEEIKHDKEHECEKGKSEGGKAEKNKADPSKAEQDKIKKESKSQQKLLKDTKSEAEAQKKKDQKKETANKGAAQSGTKKAESKKKADQPNSAKKAGPSSSTKAAKNKNKLT